MKKLSKFAYMAIGLVMGLVIAMIPTLASASTGTQNLLVTYSNIKLYVDGTLITPKDPNGNIVEPFIYNGTTYLPVRAVSQALGKTVNWDGKTSSVYIGAMPGQIQYFDKAVGAYQSSGSHFMLASDTNIGCIIMAGTKYYHGITTDNSGYGLYNLNGQYSQLSGMYGPADGCTTPCKIIFYGDGNLIQELDFNGGDMPKNFSIDLTGVLQLKIEIDGWGASIVDWQIQ